MKRPFSSPVPSLQILMYFSTYSPAATSVHQSGKTVENQQAFIECHPVLVLPLSSLPSSSLWTSSVSPADVHSSQVALVSSFPYVFSSILSVLPISKGIISSLSCRERGELHLQLLNHPGDRADLIIKT